MGDIDTIIGLDFGSHSAILALWHAEKASYEVFADELGSRVIPCAVAYRGDEIIVGQAALSQSHKNPANTFLDVRDYILNPEVSTVFVPILEKEITVQELLSHFFRNIHNQVKQQAGKIVRECVVALPGSVDDSIRARIVEAAQAGGIRIKSFINDPTSTLMAYGLDDPKLQTSTTLVVDIGWSETEVSVFTTSGGLFYPLSNIKSSDMSGKVLVKLLSEHCAKDFQRRAKFSCLDNKKSMIRLKTQCEEIAKHLSTGQEASIDIDSLCEGVDYSTKISRARFEDMAGIPIIRLKALIGDALAQAGGIGYSDINCVCMAGGVVAIPKVVATIKSLFPGATFPRGRFESSECLSIGAALHGRYLLEQGMLDTAPSVVPSVSVLPSSILISPAVSEENAIQLVAAGSTLPLRYTVSAAVEPNTSAFLRIFTKNGAETTALGDMIFSVGELGEVEVVVEIDSSGVASFEVLGGAEKESLCSLRV